MNEARPLVTQASGRGNKSIEVYLKGYFLAQIINVTWTSPPIPPTSAFTVCFTSLHFSRIPCPILTITIPESLYRPDTWPTPYFSSGQGTPLRIHDIDGKWD